jgi:hypothetical protein
MRRRERNEREKALLADKVTASGVLYFSRVSFSPRYNSIPIREKFI